MRCFTPRLSVAAGGAGSSSSGGGLLNALRKMYDGYTLWRDRRDDARYAAASMVNSAEMSAHATTTSRRICENPSACPRSVLVVPADNIPNMHRRQRRGGVVDADAVMFDLTCSGGRRAEARESILQFLESEEDSGKKTDEGHQHEQQQEEGYTKKKRRYVIQIHSPEFDSVNGILDMELAGLLGERIEGILLPSVTTNTYTLIKDHAHPSHHLWALFDTPQSILQAYDICSQGHYQYAVMGPRQLAYNLQLPIGTVSYGEKYKGAVNNSSSEDTREETLIGSLPLLHSSLQVLLAARAFDMNILDGTFDDVSDTVGFCRHVHLSRSLGFDGILVTHAAQLAPSHLAFTPTEAELAWAKRVRNKLASRSAGGRVLGRHELTQWQRGARIIERVREAEISEAVQTTAEKQT